MQKQGSNRLILRSFQMLKASPFSPITLPGQAYRRKRRFLSLSMAALVLLLLFSGVVSRPMAARADTVTIPLANQTGLDASKFTIYVLGFSTGTTTPVVVNPKMLTVDSLTKTGAFTDTPAAGAGGSFIPSYKLGDEITGIVVDRGDASTNIAGARIYFFVADSSATYSANGNPPQFPYTGDGSSVTQVANPPQEDYPVYNYVELTYMSGYGTVIDVSTVDGFFFPLTVTLNDSLGQLGQPLPVKTPAFHRQAILDSYAPFMNGLGNEGAPYLDLQYSSNSGGLLNPSHYLNSATGVTSPLNTVFDDALNTLFADNNLSIKGDASGGIESNTYTVASTANQTYQDSGLNHPALQLQGSNTINNTTTFTFTIFNPVDFCVVNYTDGSGNLQPIIGDMVDTTLTFQPPLPGTTPLLAGMFVSGAGADPTTTIVSINTGAGGEIIFLTLSDGIGTPTANSQYTFSKSSMFSISSGNMVFGNYGLFADSTGTYSADEQAVLKGLQRDIVSALNRGVATTAPISGTEGYTSLYWGTETGWYPAGQPQNLFSYFMHTATITAASGPVPVFTRPTGAVTSARGDIMGMSYGFGYDEDPVHSTVGQPPVPAKYDPVPGETTTMTVTLGPWTESAARGNYPWHMFLPAFVSDGKKRAD